jgi:DNA-directed RNA polymerase specialized sigma24 family protein
MKLRKLLRAFARGEVDASVILKDAEWSKVAESVRKRWSLPGDVEGQDIEQEMRIGAWKALLDYQAGRSRLEDFVLFRAHATARKFINKTRNTPGSVKGDELKFGRFMRNMTDLNGAASPGIDPVTEDDWPAPEPETTQTQGDAVRKLARKLSKVDDITATAVVAFVEEESVDKAARALILSKAFRKKARVKTEDEAKEFVLRSARRVAVQP